MASNQTKNRVFIKAYEAVSVLGNGIDEIFENLLNKRCFIGESSDFTIDEKSLAVGRIKDFNEAWKFCTAIAEPNMPVFKTVDCADSFQNAFEALQSGEIKNALIISSYTLNKEQILRLYKDGKYSQAVAKPFDYESDGLNAAEAVVSVLLSTDVGELELLGIGADDDLENSINMAISNSGINAEDVEYIQATATGITRDDRAETVVLSKIFGQKPVISSSKGLTGHTFEASELLNVVVAAKAIGEGIIPASAFLEHSFTNDVSFAYANRIKKIETALINSNKNLDKYTSLVICLN